MENESGKKSPRKGLYILLSVLVAVSFWVYVDEYGHNGTARLVEQKITDIPIEYINTDGLSDRGLTLLEESTSTTVDLTVEGPRRVVTAIEQSNVRITADLSSVTNSGKQPVSLNVTFTDPTRDFSDVKEKKLSISRAMVNISKLSTKEVDIRCEVVGNVAEGYLAGQVELSQQSIEIRGESDAVSPVSYAKLTLNIGKDAEKTVQQALVCQFYDENDQLLDKSGILTSEGRILAKLPVYMTKEIQLAVVFHEAPGASISNLRYDISPSSVTVSGEADKLRDLNTIILGELDLLSLVGHDSYTSSYAIVIPEGCQNLSGIDRATLTVSFKDMAIATVTPKLFQIDNPPTGKVVTLLTESLPVKIFGAGTDVASVSGETMTVIVDLNDYSSAAGVYTVPVMLDIMASGDIGVMGTYQVQVRISEELQAPVSAEDPTEEAEAFTSSNNAISEE